MRPGGVVLHIIPAHGASAVRVLAALHAQLVAIVDDGRSQVGELEEACRVHHAQVAARTRTDALRVVAAQKRPQHLLRALGIEHGGAIEGAVKLGRADFMTAKAAPDVAAEHIVHGRIEHVAHGEPLAAVIPAFRHHQAVGVDLAHHGFELPPEIRPHLRAHIQPPAVHMAFFEPVASHGQEILRAVLVLQVQLGHVAPVAEGVVSIGHFVVKAEPAAIRGGLALFHRVHKGRELEPRMVEHPIQHDAHVVFMQLVAQRAQVILRAQQRIDLEVVEGIVTVRAVAEEQGRGIDHLYTQVLEIRHRLENAAQIAAEAVLVLHAGAGPGLYRLRIGFHGFAAEAVRKDLIPNAPPRPFGHGSRRIHIGKGECLAHVLLRIRPRLQARGVKLERQLIALKHEQILDPQVPGGKDHLIKIMPLIAIGHRHFILVRAFEIIGHGVIAGNPHGHARKLSPAGLEAQAHAPVGQRMAILQPGHVIDGPKLDGAHTLQPLLIRLRARRPRCRARSM